MRIIDDARNARVDTAQGRDEITHIDVMRPVIQREPLVGRGHVFPDFAVRNDAPEHAFPGVAVTIDEARDEDSVRSIDYLAGSLEIGTYGGDLLSLDEYVGFDEIANLRIHADNGSTLQYQTTIGIARSPRVALDDLRFLVLPRGHCGRGQAGAHL